MPELDLSDSEAHDLAAYMISLKHKSAPAAYTPLPQPIDPTPVRGETLYKMYCSACHGAEGVGAIVRDALAAERIDQPREMITPSLRNIDTLGVISDDYLRLVIGDGRSGTSMLAWTPSCVVVREHPCLPFGIVIFWLRRPTGFCEPQSSSAATALKCDPWDTTVPASPNCAQARSTI